MSAGGFYDFTYASDIKSSYSFNSRTGVISVSGNVSPSDSNDYGDSYYSSTVYYKVNDHILIATNSIQICHGCGCENLPIIRAYYSYPTGHSSSYTTETYDRRIDYYDGYVYTYYSTYPDCPSCTGASSEECVPNYGGYYAVLET